MHFAPSVMKPSTIGGVLDTKPTTGGRNMRMSEEGTIEKLWRDTQPKQYSISIRNILTGATEQYSLYLLGSPDISNLDIRWDEESQGLFFSIRYPNATT